MVNMSITVRSPTIVPSICLGGYLEPYTLFVLTGDIALYVRIRFRSSASVDTGAESVVPRSHLVLSMGILRRVAIDRKSS